jgi:hypothetical protein
MMGEQVKPNSAVRPIAAVIGTLAVLAVIPAAFLAFFSIFLFDAPQSAYNGAQALALGFWLAPVACVTSAVLALRAAARGSWRLLGVAILLPILLACYVFALFPDFWR